jgi:F0F1-type ATP synthase membrane subunit b/b'
VLKVLNMVLFIGVLAYFVGGPVKNAFRERSETIRRSIDEAREPRAPLVFRERETAILVEEAPAETTLARMLREGEGVVSVLLDPPLGG